MPFIIHFFEYSKKWIIGINTIHKGNYKIKQTSRFLQYSLDTNSGLKYHRALNTPQRQDLYLNTPFASNTVQPTHMHDTLGNGAIQRTQQDNRTTL